MARQAAALPPRETSSWLLLFFRAKPAPSQEMKPFEPGFEKIKKRNRMHLEEETVRPPPRSRLIPDVNEFRCRVCKNIVGLPASGTRQRNHCPFCLSSVHVDNAPGDRSSECGSTMDAIAIWVRGEEWVLLHRCRGCGAIHSNRIAPDDNELLLLSLAAKPLGKPALPLFEHAEI